MKDRTLVVLDTWIVYIKEHQIEKLLQLYDSTAIIIPIISNSILNTPEKIRYYFEKLMQCIELDISLHQTTIHPQSIKEQLY
jgi:hypothetical protein